MGVSVNDRRLFYETIASKFDSLMNPYDLERRLSIVFDEMLPRNLAGLRTLDLGCGSGWFSQRALERGAQVTSLDISLSLVRTTHLFIRHLHQVALISSFPVKRLSILRNLNVEYGKLRGFLLRVG